MLDELLNAGFGGGKKDSEEEGTRSTVRVRRERVPALEGEGREELEPSESVEEDGPECGSGGSDVRSASVGALDGLKGE